jgi:hypothetical protein
MKKIIFILAMGGITTAFAAVDPDPDQKVLDGFKKEFPAAQQVSWSTQAEFEKAVFVMAGRRVGAYFTREGQLEGSVRDIFYDQLPLTVMTAVERRFDQPTILEVREINNGEGTHYKIRLETPKKKIRLRVSPDGIISDVEKQPR